MTAINEHRYRSMVLASVVAATGFYLLRVPEPMPLALVVLKGTGVALLALLALIYGQGRNGMMLAGIMALGALGDVLIEFDLIAGAAAFLVGHALSMWLYFRNWRPKITFIQRFLAALVVPVAVFVGAVCSPPAQQMVTAIYAFFVGGMAASAWTSRFPRYRTGIGAMMFLASDLLIFARMGPLAESALPHLLIWPLYYLGQLLICTGILGARQTA